MKIIKQLIIFCVVCCAAATPVSAYQRDVTSNLSREFSKGFDKLVELMNTDSDHAPLIKELAISAFENKMAKEITSKQKKIKRCLRSIDSEREDIKGIRDGNYDSWFQDQEGTIAQQRQNLENEWLAKIDKYLAEITNLEKEIAQYTEFQNKIQSWKNTLN